MVRYAWRLEKQVRGDWEPTSRANCEAQPSMGQDMVTKLGVLPPLCL